MTNFSVMGMELMIHFGMDSEASEMVPINPLLVVVVLMIPLAIMPLNARTNRIRTLILLCKYCKVWSIQCDK